MTNIQDIAREAQVSTATVSRVFNNPNIVKIETREKVLSVAKKMRYSPNLIAKGLKTGVTNIVALIIPDVTNPMFGIFARGCSDRLSDEGMTLALYNSDEDLDTEIGIMKVIKQQQTDGVIMTSQTAEPQSTDPYIYESSIPCVYIERIPKRKGVDTIHVDNIKAGELAANYLMDQGHQRIGIVTGLKHTYTGKLLFESFRNTLLANGRSLAAENIFEGNLKLDCGPIIAREILSAHTPPEAVYFTSDLMAFGALMTLKAEGVKIPEEISILGNGDLPMAALLSPKLTTIHYPIYKHGYLAADILIDRIKNPSRSEIHQLLEPSLIIRESA